MIKSWRDLVHPLAGGSERLVDCLARGLTELGHEVTLLAGGPHTAHAYTTVDTGGTYSQYVRGPVIERRVATPDVVVDVCNGMTFGTPVFRRIPTVLLVNHVHIDQWRTRFPAPIAAGGRAFERHAVPWMYRRCLVVAVSQSTSFALESLGYDPAKIRIVHNGLDIERLKVPRSAEPMFLVLGRLMPYKRVEIALRHWPYVRERTGGRLVIVGDGPDRKRLQALAPLDVEFAGYVSEREKLELLGSSWLLLQTAMHEGWGLVITEAGSLGTPSLGFDVPGVRDAIIDGTTGVLVRSEDEFRDEWLRLTQDRAEVARLGASARKFADEFSEEATVEQFEAVLEEAVDMGGHARRPWRRP